MGVRLAESFDKNYNFVFDMTLERLKAGWQGRRKLKVKIQNVTTFSKELTVLWLVEEQQICIQMFNTSVICF